MTDYHRPLLHTVSGSQEIRIHPNDVENVPVEKLGWLVKRLLVRGETVVVGVTTDLEDERGGAG